MPEHTGLVSDSDIMRLVNFVNKMTATVDGNGSGLPRAVATALLQATIPAQVSIMLPARLATFLAGFSPHPGWHTCAVTLATAVSHFCLP